MAFDQGTTSSRTIIFDRKGEIVGLAHKEFRQIYPKPGWVEHDPEEIWRTQIWSANEAMKYAGVGPDGIAAIGITNQRETTVVWDRDTGKPVYNAIVWQCRRTSQICDELKRRGFESEIRRRTGLVLDPYFSGTKIKWILDNVDGARERANRGELIFGNIDSWLVWNLTGGKVYATDYTNASRTMLFNINELKWDQKLLDMLDVPECMLPEVRPSCCVFGLTDGAILGARIPIAGIGGDQQAALFGQGCCSVGDAKNTYGTGCFLLMNTGERIVDSKNGLISTICCSAGDRVQYALEGSVFIGGAVVQWLRDEMLMIKTAAETEGIAESVEDNGGVYIVPAFVGLGAPYWDMYARGTVVGITRGTDRAHFVRAALESIAYETMDVLNAMEEDSGIRLNELKVDGGASANNFLMQFQADILNTRVVRPKVIETTALGAAYLAGLGVGYWRDRDEIAENRLIDRRFSPLMSAGERENLKAHWERAVKRALLWEKGVE